MDKRRSELLRLAEAEGEAAGRKAASWSLDGNTPQDTITAVCHGFDEGDPAVFDLILCRPTGLLCNWPSGLPVDQLFLAIGMDENEATNYGLMDDVCLAYEKAEEDSFWWEVERLYREAAR